MRILISLTKHKDSKLTRAHCMRTRSSQSATNTENMSMYMYVVITCHGQAVHCMQSHEAS